MDVRSGEFRVFHSERELEHRRLVDPDVLVVMGRGTRTTDVSLVPVEQLRSHRVSGRTIQVDTRVGRIVSGRTRSVGVVLGEVVELVDARYRPTGLRRIERLSTAHHFRQLVLVRRRVVSGDEVSRPRTHRVLRGERFHQRVNLLRLVVGGSRGAEGDVDGKVGAHRVLGGAVRAVTRVVRIDEDGRTRPRGLI